MPEVWSSYQGVDGDEVTEARMRVYTFFREHPVHAFTVEKIASYLKLTEREVDEAVKDLVGLKIVDQRFQYATAELASLIDEMTEGGR